MSTVNSQKYLDKYKWIDFADEWDSSGLSNTSKWTSTFKTPNESYEELPNFVGGLYIEDKYLMLRKKDGTSQNLGPITNIKTNSNLIAAIFDKIFDC